jgi:hypothetical protein
MYQPNTAAREERLVYEKDFLKSVLRKIDCPSLQVKYDTNSFKIVDSKTGLKSYFISSDHVAIMVAKDRFSNLESVKADPDIIALNIQLSLMLASNPIEAFGITFKSDGLNKTIKSEFITLDFQLDTSKLKVFASFAPIAHVSPVTVVIQPDFRTLQTLETALLVALKDPLFRKTIEAAELHLLTKKISPEISLIKEQCNAFIDRI